MQILRVKNWSKYQHYKDRCPPWIKLHFTTLSSRDWVMLNDSERVLAIACMLLASQSELPNGEFLADPDYFKRVAYLNKKPDFNSLINSGFLEVASECKQVLAKATTETETETYKEETDTPIPDFIKSEIWGDFVQHRKEKKSPLKPTTLKQVFKDLSKWKSEGDDPNEILITSIRNGWTGIFKPGAKKKKSTNGASVEYVPDDELNAWAARNKAPSAKNQIGYTYDKYRADLINWEQSR